MKITSTNLFFLASLHSRGITLWCIEKRKNVAQQNQSPLDETIDSKIGQKIKVSASR